MVPPGIALLNVLGRMQQATRLKSVLGVSRRRVRSRHRVCARMRLDFLISDDLRISRWRCAHWRSNYETCFLCRYRQRLSHMSSTRMRLELLISDSITYLA